MLRDSLTPGGEVDYSSLHGSCPTTKGEKWSATKWIHVSTFGGNVEASKAKWCACCGCALCMLAHATSALGGTHLHFAFVRGLFIVV